MSSADGVRPTRGGQVTVELSPHETRLLNLKTDLFEAGQGALSRLGHISVEHTGPSGAVTARGMAQDAEKGYSLSIQFSDPQAARSSSYHGAGLRLGAAGGTVQFTARQRDRNCYGQVLQPYSPNTSVTWTSHNTAAATISGSGSTATATGVAAGSTGMTARWTAYTYYNYTAPACNYTSFPVTSPSATLDVVKVDSSSLTGRRSPTPPATSWSAKGSAS